MAAPPTKPVSTLNSALPFLLKKATRRSTSAITSGPMPSPGRSRRDCAVMGAPQGHFAVVCGALANRPWHAAQGYPPRMPLVCGQGSSVARLLGDDAAIDLPERDRHRQRRDVDGALKPGNLVGQFGDAAVGRPQPEPA